VSALGSVSERVGHSDLGKLLEELARVVSNSELTGDLDLPPVRNPGFECVVLPDLPVSIVVGEGRPDARPEKSHRQCEGEIPLHASCPPQSVKSVDGS